MRGMGIHAAMRRLLSQFDLTIFIVDCVFFCAIVALLGEFWRWLSTV
jgi:hypothetical protein